MKNQSTPSQGPQVSVVVPVFNGGDDLQKCLDALFDSEYPIHECLLVDDASTDGMVDAAAQKFNARVIRMQQQSGPAVARNHGVEAAEGEIILFIDADVLLHPHSIGEAVRAFIEDPELAAVFGSYDDNPSHSSFLSQYRNLYHHWIHQTGSVKASTFWTGCGAIRRQVFLDAGGFNQNYERPSIEDIELGGRLRRSGHRIHLLKNMLATHTKDWRFWNMVRTDIFQRGVPWMLLVLDKGQLNTDLNLNYKSRLATLFAGLLVAVLMFLPILGHARATLPSLVFLLASYACSSLADRSSSTFTGRMSVLLTGLLTLVVYVWVDNILALIPLVLIVLIVGSHMAFYTYVASKRNMAFATAVIPMQVVFFIGCAIAIPVAVIKRSFFR